MRSRARAEPPALRPSRPEPAGLTERERHLQELIGEGLTNRQIGERPHLAGKTIRNDVSDLLAKLGVRRRAVAAHAARSQHRRQGAGRSGGHDRGPQPRTS